MNQTMPGTNDTIPLFPLSHGVFPDGMLRLQIFEPRYLDLIKRCHREQTPFGVVWLKQGREVQTPGDAPEFHTVGCLAHIRRHVEVQPALLQIVCQGGLRFEFGKARSGIGLLTPKWRCRQSFRGTPIRWGRPSPRRNDKAWRTVCRGCPLTGSTIAAGWPTDTPRFYRSM
jgi:Lon protease-like protein